MEVGAFHFQRNLEDVPKLEDLEEQIPYGTRLNLKRADEVLPPRAEGFNPPLQVFPCSTNTFDLFVFKGDIMLADNHSLVGAPRRYQIRKALGQGTFGCVYLADELETNQEVAIKVVKNSDAYSKQARSEIKMLEHIMRMDPAGQYNMVRMTNAFIWKACKCGGKCRHICLVFETLTWNMYELMKKNFVRVMKLLQDHTMPFPPRDCTEAEIAWVSRGFSIHTVQLFVRQILESLMLLKEHSVIHCDLKPENILHVKPQANKRAGTVKLIDFGSSCFEGEAAYTYIQSRFYRAPEVIVRAKHQYTTAIDMWSLGCVAAELFLGTPLFYCSNQYELLRDIHCAIGPIPHKLLNAGTKTDTYFVKRDGQWVFRDYEDHKRKLQEEGSPLPIEQEKERRFACHRGKKLHDIILQQEIGTEEMKSEEECARRKDEEYRTRDSLYEFIAAVLDPDPESRLTPKQALMHPFIQGGAPDEDGRIGSWVPPKDEDIPLPEGMLKKHEVPRYRANAVPIPQQPGQFSPEQILQQQYEARNAAFSAAQAAFQQYNNSLPAYYNSPAPPIGMAGPISQTLPGCDQATIHPLQQHSPFLAPPRDRGMQIPVQSVPSVQSVHTAPVWSNVNMATGERTYGSGPASNTGSMQQLMAFYGKNRHGLSPMQNPGPHTPQREGRIPHNSVPRHGWRGPGSSMNEDNYLAGSYGHPPNSLSQHPNSFGHHPNSLSHHPGVINRIPSSHAMRNSYDSNSHPPILGRHSSNLRRQSQELTPVQEHNGLSGEPSTLGTMMSWQDTQPQFQAGLARSQFSGDIGSNLGSSFGSRQFGGDSQRPSPKRSNVEEPGEHWDPGYSDELEEEAAYPRYNGFWPAAQIRGVDQPRVEQEWSGQQARRFREQQPVEQQRLGQQNRRPQAKVNGLPPGL